MTADERKLSLKKSAKTNAIYQNCCNNVSSVLSTMIHWSPVLLRKVGAASSKPLTKVLNCGLNIQVFVGILKGCCQHLCDVVLRETDMW